MSGDTAIKVEHVSKKYCKNIKSSMLYGLTDIARNVVGLSSNPHIIRKNEFWAVNDVSFEVKKGEILGIIGSNGSGKTTLLKMLNGIFWPDKGKITVKGSVGALIAVGAGFHQQLSGRENVYINGAILGMTKKEIDSKFDSIVDFADIGDFLDTPVKHYSSGMNVRLGFAIAIHSEAEILLIDEVLSVGDIDFQAKCMRKMKEIEKKGMTMIFISHNLNSVQLICNRVLYLNKGIVRTSGNTSDVLNEFKKDVLNGQKDTVSEVRFGTKEVEITDVLFLDKNERTRNIFKRGEYLKIKIKYNSKHKVYNPKFNIGFITKGGLEISKASTRDHGIEIDSVDGSGEINYIIESIPLNVGKFWITVSCYQENGHTAYDHHNQLYQLLIEDGAINGVIRERFGLFYIPSRWEINKEIEI